MELLVVENHELPTVNDERRVPGGTSSATRPTSSGSCNLMAAVWDEGTKRRTAEQIADELAGIGASLSIGADWDTSRRGCSRSSGTCRKALEIYADVLRNPAFPEAELGAAAEHRPSAG